MDRVERAEYAAARGAAVRRFAQGCRPDECDGGKSRPTQGNGCDTHNAAPVLAFHNPFHWPRRRQQTIQTDSPGKTDRRFLFVRDYLPTFCTCSSRSRTPTSSGTCSIASRRPRLFRLASLSKAGRPAWIIGDRKGAYHHRRIRPSAGRETRQRVVLAPSRCNQRHSPLAFQTHSLEQSACPGSTGRHHRIPIAKAFAAHPHSVCCAALEPPVAHLNVVTAQCVLIGLIL